MTSTNADRVGMLSGRWVMYWSYVIRRFVANLACALFALAPWTLATAPTSASGEQDVASVQTAKVTAPVDSAHLPIPDTSQSANIFAYPPDYFAVQLLAAKDKKTITDFVSDHDLGDPPYGAMRSRGQVWYVLLLGIYPDRQEAEKAVARLPLTDPPVRPWIRKLGPLQESIRRVKQ